MKFLKKLFFSNVKDGKLGHKVLKHQIDNFVFVYNNTDKYNSNAIGIERLLKLFLIISQFLFPGIYIRALFGSISKNWKNIGVEIYVIIKLIISILILKNDWFLNPFLYFWTGYMITETLHYTATLYFCNDVFAKPHSDKRNVILLLIDYVEVVNDFASLYLANQCLKFSNGENVINSLDGLYFSFVSSLTIGYGDISPSNIIGKKLVILQAMVFLAFGVVFLNYFAGRLQNENPKETKQQLRNE